MIEENKLLKAVLRRSVQQVQDCVVDGEDPHYTDEHGRSYLHLAVFLRSKDLVKYFLDEGLDVNHKDHDGVTALHRACRTGCESIIGLLLRHKADAMSEAKNSIQPLHVAAAFGHSLCLQMLCSKARALSIDAVDSSEHTPMHFAAADGHLQAARTLIREQCDVNACNVAGNRPLHFAATSGNPQLCRLLVEAGADIDAQNSNGQTALHLATQQACEASAMSLLSAGADPNIRDIKGNTCSHLAIKNGHIDLLTMITSHEQTDPSISDIEENTVLHVALKLGHFNLVPMMLPRAKDLTKQNASGCSIIIEAIKNQEEDLALEMLKYCPSLVNTATHDLVTPLHLAAERGMISLTKELLMAGAEVDAPDISGLTPSLYCAKNDSVLECLAMIENLMVYHGNRIDEQQQQHVKGGAKSKMPTRISS